MSRGVRLIPGALLTSVVAFLIGAGIGASQRDRPAETLAWTGTVTVERRAAGSVSGTGPDAVTLGFTGTDRATYTLNGDGTASWTGTFSNNLDMGGLFGIPTRGSGSGAGYGGAEFNGQGWDIGVEADDEMPVETDYTPQDQYWDTHFSLILLLREFAKASGQPAPPVGPRVERGARTPAGVVVPARGTADATSLSGSITETSPSSDEIGGFPTIPMTFTVTWNLKKVPVRPHVKIYGPECGCLDQDATEKTLHFVAGASPGGGEFSEFHITSDGVAPEVVSNIAGDRPSLDIIGTKATGHVTIRITYRRNGIATVSDPIEVDFCAIEEFELSNGNAHDISFDLEGRLPVDAKARAWRGGKDISAELEWEIDGMGAPTSLTAEPSTKKGDHITFTYENMPRRNSDFGEKTLTAKTSGKCACERRDTVRTFYPDIDSNHPDDATPNWYYYWKQTSAAPDNSRPLLVYREQVTDANVPGTTIARYDHETGKILISTLVFGHNGCRDQVDATTHDPTGRHAVGIDCFAETVRHEMQHRTDAVDWWGSPAGPYGVSLLDWFGSDWDHDQVPNRVEELLAGCQPGTPLLDSIDLTRLTSLMSDLIAKGKTTWFTCHQRPFTDTTDAEINAYWHGWTWPIGSANREDWSCGELSKQWTGRRCGT